MGKRLSHNDFLKRVKSLTGNEYTLLGKYEGSTKKLLMKHNVCGHEYMVAPYLFSDGRRCPNCAGSMKLTHKEFIKTVKKSSGNEFVILSEYKNMRTKVKVRHSICGYEWEQIPSSLTTDKNGCPKCARNLKWNTDKYKEAVIKLTGNEYGVIDNYINTRTPLLMIHNKCGNKFTVTPNDFTLKDSRCPKCKESRGEQRISEYLDKFFYEYKRQHRIKECRNERVLPFDFAVFNDGNLLCLIEFEGAQHFEPIKYWGGERHFKKVQRRDKIKRDYCKSNNIPLIEIPYWELDNIENILHKDLFEIHRMNNIKHKQLRLLI